MSISQAQHLPDLADALKTECMENLGGLEEYLGSLARQGGLRLDDPKEAAMQLANHATGGIAFLISRP
jgi:hypothetical protein